jgi:hypothetical protein
MHVLRDDNLTVRDRFIVSSSHTPLRHIPQKRQQRAMSETPFLFHSGLAAAVVALDFDKYHQNSKRQKQDEHKSLTGL